MSNKGFTLWFTGLSGAGKSTLAEYLTPVLRERGVRVEVLDGDEIRENLSKGLGFSKEDRDTNIRRIGYVANLLSRNGVVRDHGRDLALPRRSATRSAPSAQAPSSRSTSRRRSTSLEERDTKGLYKKARAGEIKNFTGISDPYEPPDQAGDHGPHRPTSRSRSRREKILVYLEAKKLIAGVAKQR